MNKELFEYLKESLEDAVDHAAGKKFLPTTVYKLDSTGRKRMWKIWVDGDESKGVINILSGLVDGEKVPQKIEITEGKNIGKANETNPYTQAVAEAQAKLKLQLRSGYVENEEDVKASGTLGSGLKSPMLAVTFDPKGERKSSKTLKQLGIENKEVGLQCKMDGNRMLVVVNKKGATAWTRKGDLMPIQLRHILNVIETAYNDPTYQHQDEVIIDGEVLNPNMSFNESNGFLKRFKNNPNTLVLGEYVYYIYDVVMDAPYKVRNSILSMFRDDKFVKLLPTEYIKATDAVLKDRLEKFIADGQEGLIIRNLEMPYEHKRSKGLIKYKAFSDSEFKLVGMEEDARGGFVGNFILEMDEPSVDVNGKPILTFKAGTTGMTQEELAKVWKNRDSYVGTLCTVEFFERSEYKVPRFGKVKELNRTDF